MTGLRLLESIHGHLGILATAALIHPAILLRRGNAPTRRNRWALSLSAAFSVAAWSAGILIYGDYRRDVKRGLFQASARAGLFFETKEHLAMAVVCLATGALVAALVAPRHARPLRQTAALVFALAAALSALVAGLGTYVSSVHGF